MNKRCILILATLIPAGVSHADDWPGWRGPNRDGISKETGLLQSWPDNGPPVAWTAQDLGAGYSSVAVAGGKVFGAGKRDNDEVVWCLDEKTGKQLWSTIIGPGQRASRGDGPRGTPTIDGDRLYHLDVNGLLVCLDAGTGKLVWSKSLPKDFGGKMMSGWGWSESPLIDGNLVLASPGGKGAGIVALDKKTGNTVWKANVPGDCRAAYSSIVVSNGGGVKQYVQLLRCGAVGVRAKDGKFLWSNNSICNGTAMVPTPIVDGNHVFVSTGYRTGSALIELTPDGQGGVNAKQLYFKNGNELQNHHGGLILLDGHIYGGHGHNAGAPICLNMKTGEFAWKENRGPGSGSAAIAYADGHVYFRYQDGKLALIEASPRGYKLKSAFKLASQSRLPSWPHPVIANGKLFIRDQDKLFCFNIKK